MMAQTLRIRAPPEGAITPMKEPVSTRRGLPHAGPLARAALLAAIALSLLFAAPRLFSLLRPFFFAVPVAALLTPLVSRASRILHIAKKPVAILLIALVVLSLFALFGWLLQAIIGETVLLAMNMQAIWDAALSALEPHMDKLSWLLSFFPGEADEAIAAITQNVAVWFQNVSRNFVNTMLFNATTIAEKIGVSTAGTIICMIAAFYITVDRRQIVQALRNGLGERMFRIVRMIKNAAKTALIGYLRAQLLLAVYTLILILPSFLIIGQPYALLISIFIAFIDFLPIIGTSAALVPWGILEYIGGDVVKGIFLCALALVDFLLRRLLEPKVVGKQMNIHPLIALMSIYAGMKLVGFIGAILGPVAAVIALSMKDAWEDAA